MDFDFTPEQTTFRDDLREFLTAEAPVEKQAVFGRTTEDQYQFGREVRRKLAARNWLAIGLPEEYSGGGKGPIEQGILAESLGYQRVPEAGIVGLEMVAPTILALGTSEQKDQFLPSIASGEVEYCVGLSELDAGSDRAPLKLIAERDGDGYVLKGTQTFTGHPFQANYMFLLARTDPKSEIRLGTSLFIVDVNTAGINLRPLPLINGETAAEATFDNVSLPASCRIGEENQGCSHAMTAINYERAGLGRYGAVRRVFDDFTDFCNDSAPDGGQPLAEHPLVRHQLAQRRLGMETWKLLCWKVAWMRSTGEDFTAEAAVAALFGSEERLRFAEMAMEVLGPFATLKNGSPLVPLLGNVEGIHREALDLQGADTVELQRDIIAQRNLGMVAASY